MLRLLLVIATVLLLFGCSSTQPSYNYVNTASRPTSAPAPKTSTPRPVPKRQLIKPNYPQYVVQKGDTLSSISRVSGLSVERIKHYNQLKSSRLEIGQRLYLPGVYKLAKAPTPTLSVPSVQTVSRNVSIVPRSRWAKYKIKGNVTKMGKVSKITVHHTDDGPKLSKISDVKFLQGIENHHRNNRKWACIGYHFVIGRDGTIYQGRPVQYQGAHARSNNPNNIGISLIGDFNKGYPAKSQLSSLSALLGNLRSKYGVSSKSVYGHRHLNQTECPGKYLALWLNSYRAGR
ncbi:MAG: N-acetylmuramoyl-L-alanine amidase [Lentisphaeraceae bacterium]|nr:N-acetylmuramoyl-L-alanine amidase [Lentisphaeraceae bacterium]